MNTNVLNFASIKTCLAIVGKAATIIIGAVTLIFYFSAVYRSNLYVAMISICLLLSFISLLFNVLVPASSSKVFKLIDAVYHGVSSLSLLFLTTLFILGVKEMDKENQDRNVYILSPVCVNFDTRPEKAKAIASAVLSVSNGLIYALVSVVICFT